MVHLCLLPTTITRRGLDSAAAQTEYTTDTHIHTNDKQPRSMAEQNPTERRKRVFTAWQNVIASFELLVSA